MVSWLKKQRSIRLNRGPPFFAIVTRVRFFVIFLTSNLALVSSFLRSVLDIRSTVFLVVLVTQTIPLEQSWFFGHSHPGELAKTYGDAFSCGIIRMCGRPKVMMLRWQRMVNRLGSLYIDVGVWNACTPKNWRAKLQMHLWTEIASLRRLDPVHPIATILSLLSGAYLFVAFAALPQALMASWIRSK